MNAFTAKEYTCYYARVLDTDLPLAVDVICDMLTGSLIAAEDVEAERGVILEEIAMTEDDPGDLVHDLFATAMLGDSPLGRPILGTVETINALTRPQIARFYKRHYDPAHLVVAAAGNLDHDTVVRQVARGVRARRRTAGRHARPGAAARRRPAPSAPPDASRSPTAAPSRRTWCSACRACPVTDERRWALGVLNAALGGGMSSRLFQEVREKRGLAYSVYSYSSSYADCGLFGVYAGCQPGRVDEVLEDLPRRARQGVAENGLTEEELGAAVGQMRRLHRARPGGHRLADEPDRQERARATGEHLSVDEMLGRIARSPWTTSARWPRRAGPAPVAGRHRPDRRAAHGRARTNPWPDRNGKRKR